MKTYLIGDIAKKMNVTTDTLRYYDKEGLLPFAKRNEAGRRIFTEDDLGYVEVINCLKKSAVPVKEIGQFIEWCMQGDQTLEQRYDFMVKREVDLERQIKELETQLAFLRWKKWYYARAKAAKTESVNFKPGTQRSDPALYDYYQKLHPASNKFIE